MKPTYRTVVNWLEVKTQLRQLTTAPHGHILTNTGVWSHDGQWIVYDTRSDPAGATFDGDRIERVHVETGCCEVVFQSPGEANCGVATCSPIDSRIVCILGPDKRSCAATKDEYSAYNRCGIIFRPETNGSFEILDARNVLPPFTAGALRGGTHLHTFSGDGQWIAMTYEDMVLAKDQIYIDCRSQLNQRNIAVAVPDLRVEVPAAHPHNYAGSHFTTVVTRTLDQPTAGTDEIDRAYEEAWVGSSGYRRDDGSWQQRAIAFLGDVRGPDNQKHTEVFICDLPTNMQIAGLEPLEGTVLTRPQPPLGTTQRRLTFTTHRAQRGIGGPRHWVRSSSDGERIGFLMRDERMRVQLFTVCPRGGELRQVTHSNQSIESAFTWSPDQCFVAYASQGMIWVVEIETGKCRSVASLSSLSTGPRPEAVVFSPCGSKIAFVAAVENSGRVWNQVFLVATLPT